MVGEEPRRPSWIGKYWPEYAQTTAGPRPVAAPLLRWAEAHVVLAPATRRLLVAIAAEASKPRPCRLSLSELVAASGTSRNTCRRHLDRLMTAGLLMVKPWCGPGGQGALGYEIRLIADEDARLAALDHGFTTERSTTTTSAGLGRGEP